MLKITLTFHGIHLHWFMLALNALLRKFAELRLVVIGDVMLDHYVIGDARRLSPEAPVPVVAVAEDRYVLGAAGNVALNAARLGCSVEIVGTVGIDGAGSTVKNLLQTNGICSDLLFESAAANTVTKSRIIARGQQLCRIDREDGREKYALGNGADIAAICQRIRSSDGVILSDYAKGTLTSGNVAEFVDTANSAGIFIAIDPKPGSGLTFSGLSLMTPNRAEAAQLVDLAAEQSDELPMEEICRRIMAKYSVKQLVVTLGADGMMICDCGGKISQIPTYAKEVFDVSGAGDTSIACLTLSLVAGESIANAAKFANVAAGIVVSKHGTAAISAAELLSDEKLR
jgi:D-beta-D-heptose 7-phosphate kinase/D-beta-D-heptose 1-phosphate adenosyltransferase